jgi:hypothetical protein
MPGRTSHGAVDARRARVCRSGDQVGQVTAAWVDDHVRPLASTKMQHTLQYRRSSTSTMLAAIC